MSEATSIKKDLILELKAILERKNDRPYSYDEAARVGRGLVEIYDELADNPLGIGHVKTKGGSNENRKLNGNVNDDKCYT